MVTNSIRPHSHLYHSTVFEQRAQEILTSQTQPLTYCQNTTQSATSTTAPTTSSDGIHGPPPSASTSQVLVKGKVDLSAAIGGSLGGVLGLVVLGAVIALLRYRRRLRQLRAARDPILDSHNFSEDRSGSETPARVITPFVSQYRAASSPARLPSECTIYWRLSVV